MAHGKSHQEILLPPGENQDPQQLGSFFGDSKKKAKIVDNFFQTNVRTMSNGDIVLPSSAAFVVKEISNFDTSTNTVDLKATLIIRVKLTNAHRLEEVSERIQGELKARWNESESVLQDESCRVQTTKSKDWEKGMPNDIVQYTIRLEKQMQFGFDDYADFPFDRQKPRFKFELSHFELENAVNGKNDIYRFDLYFQENQFSFKDGVDNLPEFDCDFRHIKVEHIQEKKPEKKDGLEIKNFYYPGFKVELLLARDPLLQILNLIFPAILLSYFTAVSSRVDGVGDMLGSISIGILTYIAMIGQIRDCLPPVQCITFADKIIVVYIFYCLVPVVDEVHFGDFLAGPINWVIVGVINLAIILVTAYRYISQRQCLHQDPPKQEKVKGSKKSPDSSWFMPQEVLKHHQD